MGILAHGPCTHCSSVYLFPWDQANQMAVYGAITQSFSCAGWGRVRFHQEANHDPFMVPAGVWGGIRVPLGGDDDDSPLSPIRLEAHLLLPKVGTVLTPHTSSPTEPRDETRPPVWPMWAVWAAVYWPLVTGKQNLDAFLVARCLCFQLEIQV